MSTSLAVNRPEVDDGVDVDNEAQGQAYLGVA